MLWTSVSDMGTGTKGQREYGIVSKSTKYMGFRETAEFQPF
jgi:hypothetical protein